MPNGENEMKKLKFKIKENISCEKSWAKNMGGQIIEICSDDGAEINVGKREDLGVEQGAYIKLRNLELIGGEKIETIIKECYSCCHCCCCKKC